MVRFKRWLIPFFLFLSLGAIMGQDGFCFFAGNNDDGVLITDDGFNWF